MEINHVHPHAKFEPSIYKTFSRYELFSSDFGKVQTDGQTESDVYEPTVQFAQVGSKRGYYIRQDINQCPLGYLCLRVDAIPGQLP